MTSEENGAKTVPIIIPTTQEGGEDYIVRCAAVILPEGSFHDRDTNRVRIPTPEGTTAVYFSLEDTLKGNTKARVWLAQKQA